MKSIVLTMVGLCFAIASMAQQYEQSAGLRLGHSAGLTYKKFIKDEHAVEFMLTGRNDGAQVSGLYVYHTPLQFSFNNQFFLYYGAGAHLGYEKYFGYRKALNPQDPDQFFYTNKSFYAMGIDGLIGLEYRILSVPMTASFDLKPYFNFFGMRYTKTRFWDAAITVKYIF